MSHYDPKRSELHNLLLRAVDALNSIKSDGWSTPEEKKTRLEAELKKFDTEFEALKAKPGFNINARDSMLETPLIYAILHPVLLEKLLKAGADPNLRNNESYTPLLLLASWPIHNPEPYEVLIQHGADVKLTKSFRWYGSKTPHEIYTLMVRPERQNSDVLALLSGRRTEAWRRRRAAVNAFERMRRGPVEEAGATVKNSARRGGRRRRSTQRLRSRR